MLRAPPAETVGRIHSRGALGIELHVADNIAASADRQIPSHRAVQVRRALVQPARCGHPEGRGGDSRGAFNCSDKSWGSTIGPINPPFYPALSVVVRLVGAVVHRA